MLLITGAPNILTSSGDWTGVVTLWENGAVSDVSAGTIKAALQDSQGRPLISPVSQSNVAPAVWSTGIVAIVFTAATLAGLYRHSDSWLEIKSTIAGLTKTWPLLRVEIQTGTIP